MKYDPSIHHRRSIRLKSYDYSQAGMYFVTICTQNHECFFGHMANCEMRLNDAGIMIQSVWDDLPNRFTNLELDAVVVMPNHIHGIFVLGHGNDHPGHCTGESCIRPHPESCIRPHPESCIRPHPESCIRPHPESCIRPNAAAGTLPGTVGRMVQAFKSITTHQYIQGVKQSGWPLFPGKLWQRNYWEHVIRNDSELNRIREYIQNNPAQWEYDTLNIHMMVRPTVGGDVVGANLVFAPNGPNTPNVSVGGEQSGVIAGEVNTKFGANTPRANTPRANTPGANTPGANTRFAPTAANTATNAQCVGGCMGDTHNPSPPPAHVAHPVRANLVFAPNSPNASAAREQSEVNTKFRENTVGVNIPGVNTPGVNTPGANTPGANTRFAPTAANTATNAQCVGGCMGDTHNPSPPPAHVARPPVRANLVFAPNTPNVPNAPNYASPANTTPDKIRESSPEYGTEARTL